MAGFLKRMGLGRAWGTGFASALAASVFLACGPASVASAGIYVVAVCTPDSPAGEDILTASTTPSLFTTPCTSGLGHGIRQVALAPFDNSDKTTWRLRAPVDTTIRRAIVNRTFSGAGNAVSYRLWAVPPGGIEVLEAVGFPAQVPNGVRTFDVNAPVLEGELTCAQGIGCNLLGGETPIVVNHRELLVELQDSDPPSVSVGGSLFDGVVGGVQDVTFDADDRGAGIARVELRVDGVEVLSMEGGNGGRCVLPYRFLVPCPLALAASFSLDTATLPDGDHQVRVRVIDAGSGVTNSPTRTVTIRNAPRNTVAPTLSGTAEVDAELVASFGDWTGEAPVSFAFQWLRCPAHVSAPADAAACVEIAGADGPRRRVDQADQANRLMARVTATNQKGREVAHSAPSGLVPRRPGATPPRPRPPASASAPALSAVSVSPKRVRSGRRATLRLTSSEPARLSIAIERPRSGRASKRVARRVRRIDAGRSRLRLVAGIGGRPMAPGRYRLKLVATDSDGGASKAKTIPFVVVG